MIGIYSGTFDPIHQGHLEFVRTSLMEAEIDKVVIMPEPSPRRKKNVTDISHRQQMIELAIQDTEGVEVFVPDDNNQHSLDSTWRLIHDKYGHDQEYALMMGVDVLEFIENWGQASKDSETVINDLREVFYIVALRTEDDGETAINIKSKLGLKMKLIISEKPTVSSSNIRTSLISSIEPIGAIDSVINYVKDKKLYEPAN